ncbi:MAG: DUF1467 family protein [Proteobacteria bacterium]|nr:DUF1467 family protein [Pseudomonadota bacterium]
MGWVSGLAIYVVIWWVVLFTVLPWGVRPVDEPAPGHVESAPANPRLLLKFAVTTAVAAVLWVAVYVVVESGLIDLRSAP